MSRVSLGILAVLVAVLAAMLLFIVCRRAWRALAFRRLDRWQQYWLQRLPRLLQGEFPSAEELQSRAARQSLESVIITRLATNDSDHQRLIELLERSGLLDHHLAVLRRGTPWQRHQSAAMLGKMDSAEAVPALVEALDDKWPQVREAALRSLSAIGSLAAGPGVIRFLRRRLPLEPGAWLDAAIACIPDPNDVLPLLEDDRPQVRELAARAIAESSGVARFEVLDSLLFDSDPEVRAQVVRAVGKSASQHADTRRILPLLIAAAQDDIWFVRLRALAVLATVGSADCIEAVLRATEDSNFTVRRQAAATLASLAVRPNEVLHALKGRNDRYALESYLSQLARSGLLWRTVPLLCSEDNSVRRAAEELLGTALSAGYSQEVVSSAETQPEQPVREAAARLLEHAAAADRLLMDEPAHSPTLFSGT